jgi:hypothetical protein
MTSRAQKKIKEISGIDLDDAVDSGKEIAEEISSKGSELAKVAGQWLKKNDLMGIAVLTVGVGLFSYLITKGRRFIIVV